MLPRSTFSIFGPGDSSPHDAPREESMQLQPSYHLMIDPIASNRLSQASTTQFRQSKISKEPLRVTPGTPSCMLESGDVKSSIGLDQKPLRFNVERRSAFASYIGQCDWRCAAMACSWWGATAMSYKRHGRHQHEIQHYLVMR